MQRGFQINIESTTEKRIWADQAARHVRRILEKVDPDEPLFLFVNIYDAHDPYPAIPGDVDWVPEQPEIELHAQTWTIGFYEKLGFVAEGPEFLEAEIPHRRMVRQRQCGTS